MKVNKLIEFLKKEKPDTEIVLHDWDGNKSNFISLEIACNGGKSKSEPNKLILIRSPFKLGD